MGKSQFENFKHHDEGDKDASNSLLREHNDLVKANDATKVKAPTDMVAANFGDAGARAANLNERLGRLDPENQAAAAKVIYEMANLESIRKSVFG